MRLRFYRKIARDENNGNDKTSALLRFDRYLKEEEEEGAGEAEEAEAEARARKRDIKRDEGKNERVTLPICVDDMLKHFSPFYITSSPLSF